ncbi:MAG: OmpA family protein [Myxococcaceae bacterium]|nr:OmpA family protein [Myxococcaceae bacterium]
MRPLVLSLLLLGGSPALADEARHLQVSATLLGEVFSRSVGGEVRVSYSLSRIFDAGLGVNIGASPGLLLTGRFHTPWQPDARVRPFGQLRAVAHPATQGFGAGLYGGAMVELGPGRLEAGLVGHVYLPVAGLLPYAVFAQVGYELDVLGARERVETTRDVVGRTAIRGRLHDLDDAPLGRAEVRITGGALPAALTASGSEFAFDLEPGDYQVMVQAPGHLMRGARATLKEGEQLVFDIALRPEPKTRSAALTGTRVAISQQIQFELSRARILPESNFILDEVVDVLLRNPRVQQVRVEGHTDNVGSAEVNQRLSESRAFAVMQYLIEKGVEPSRLRGEGFGPTRPIADNATEEGRAKNRRVQFEIVE